MDGQFESIGKQSLDHGHNRIKIDRGNSFLAWRSRKYRGLGDDIEAIGIKPLWGTDQHFVCNAPCLLDQEFEVYSCKIDPATRLNIEPHALKIRSRGLYISDFELIGRRRDVQLLEDFLCGASTRKPTPTFASRRSSLFTHRYAEKSAIDGEVRYRERPIHIIADSGDG